MYTITGEATGETEPVSAGAQPSHTTNRVVIPQNWISRRNTSVLSNQRHEDHRLQCVISRHSSPKIDSLEAILFTQDWVPREKRAYSPRLREVAGRVDPLLRTERIGLASVEHEKGRLSEQRSATKRDPRG